MSTSINLVKGAKINLQKQDGGKLNHIMMGLGWDPINSSGVFNSMFGGSSGQSIDLDASCVMFDDQNHEIDSIWFGQLRSRDGSIQHTGG